MRGGCEDGAVDSEYESDGARSLGSKVLFFFNKDASWLGEYERGEDAGCDFFPALMFATIVVKIDFACGRGVGCSS